MYFAAKTMKNGNKNQEKRNSDEKSSDVTKSNGLEPAAEFISKTGKLYLQVLFICKTWKMKIEKSECLQQVDVDKELEIENENIT